MCDVCNNLTETKEVKYQEGTYGSLSLTKFGRRKTLLIVDFSKCPKYANCSAKDVPVRQVFEIKYCPNCGAKLEEEYYSVERINITNEEVISRLRALHLVSEDYSDKEAIQ